jgi:hypothetical protein
VAIQAVVNQTPKARQCYSNGLDAYQYGMIRFGNGIMGFVRKTRLSRFTPLPLLFSIQFAKAKDNA